MDPTVLVYRGAAAEPELEFRLWNVAAAGLARLFGAAADRVSLRQLRFFNVPEEEPQAGLPVVHNLNPEWGYARVSLVIDDQYAYSHPHGVAELIAAPLQLMLAGRAPADTEWGFCVVVPGMPGRPTVRPSPAVEGAAALTPYEDGETPTFRISPVPEPPLPPRTLLDFDVREFDQARRSAPVKVLVPAALREDLNRRDFSAEVEEGGFLVGRVWDDRDQPGTTLVELTTAPPAEHTGASFLHFTFTGNSFESVKRDLRTSGTPDRLVGWYHTHLFPATDAMGLSSIDLKLHFTTFRQPWQVAGLLNLEADRRVLRFYVRQGDAMAECPQWVVG